MIGLIVELTKSEWKILSRQIGYEHGDSGTAVLAVFTGGSICAMIAVGTCFAQIISDHRKMALTECFYIFYSLHVLSK